MDARALGVKLPQRRAEGKQGGGAKCITITPYTTLLPLKIVRGMRDVMACHVIACMYVMYNYFWVFFWDSY